MMGAVGVGVTGGVRAGCDVGRGVVECVYVILAFLFRHSREGGNLGGGMTGAGVWSSVSTSFSRLRHSREGGNLGGGMTGAVRAGNDGMGYVQPAAAWAQ